MNAARDSTFRILHAASRFEIKQRKRAQKTDKHRFANRLFIELAVFPFVMALILITIMFAFKLEWLLESSLVALLLAYFGTIFHPLISAWIHRKSLLATLKHPFGILLQNAAATTAVDLKYSPKLERKPLALLEIIALEVKSERDSFERRLSLVVGSIEKVGLAPGLLAAFLSLPQLPGNSNQWVLSLAYATPALYFFGAMAHFLAMRLDRMSKLLELVIARKRAALTNPSTGRQKTTLFGSLRATRSSTGYVRC